MGYWLKRILNIMSLGILCKRYSIYYCCVCKKLVSKTHTSRDKFKDHIIVSFGWKKDKYDPRDLLYKHIYFFKGSIPEKVDLRQYAEKVGDQGNEGSCTGWAGRYLKGWYEKKQKDYPDNGLSARCIYNGAKAIGGYLNEEGAYPRDIMQFLKDYGTCTEERWPYIPNSETNVDPRTKIPLSDMSEWQIERYVRLETINEVLEALASGIPVYLGVLWHSNWILVGPNGKLPKGNGKIVGGHAILALGYDLKERRILFENSWSQLWGQMGYGWVLMDDLIEQEKDMDMWIVTDKEPINPPSPPEPSKYCKFLKQIDKMVHDEMNRVGCK